MTDSCSYPGFGLEFASGDKSPQDFLGDGLPKRRVALVVLILINKERFPLLFFLKTMVQPIW